MTDNEDEIALYDSIERAIANVRAALDAIDQAWIRVTAERPIRRQPHWPRSTWPTRC
ncbi:hypothetical protein QO058_14010 [Bosea vestrisii]|uniref:hypothetical protein n=1 Tax=Bosea vestrisii TaxID=151416 RepID=UPI0024DF36D5|nr:hypothetical protein [Bosea vestrisii]WID99252.1 hypothetical protein QO058_14010 [Bosea vestrisii]